MISTNANKFDTLEPASNPDTLKPAYTRPFTIIQSSTSPAQVEEVITNAGYTLADFCTAVQSSRLLAMSETDIQRIRAIYNELSKRGLLAMFWSVFKNEMQERKNRPEWKLLPARLKDVITWQVFNIRVVFDPNCRMLVISSKEDYQIRTFHCDVYWNPKEGKSPDFKRIMRTIKRTGLQAEINQIIAVG